MFASKLKMDSIAAEVAKIMSEEESGLRMAAHAAHRQNRNFFTFQGKTYPVKVQGETVGWGESIEEASDCVTKPEAKVIAKKEVHGHEKKMHKEEKEESSKMTAAYGKNDQEETPARKSIKAHGGPVPQPKMGLGKTLKDMKEEYLEDSEYTEESLDEALNEVLSKDASAGDWIHDFVHSKNPKFAGKTKAKRKEMALAAYYAKQRNEEVENDICPECMQDPCVCGGNHIDEEINQINEAELKTKTAYVPYVYTDRHGSGFGGYDVHYSKEADAHAHLARHGHMDINGKKGWVEKHEIAKHPSGRWVDANHMRRHGSGMNEEVVDEALVGNQKKLDKNKNNKLDAQDFKMLRGQKNTKETYGEALNPKKKTMDTLAGRVKVPADTQNQHTSTKVELNAEGWDDMMKSVQDRAKPQPSGGSGVKQGSRYGGSKQKDKPEQDDDKKMKEGYKVKLKSFSEAKRPDDDSVPFVTNEAKPLNVAKELAHKAMKRIKNEMLGKTGTSE